MDAQLISVNDDGLDDLWLVPTAHDGVQALVLLEIPQDDWPPPVKRVLWGYRDAVLTGKCPACDGCRPLLNRETRRRLRSEVLRAQSRGAIDKRTGTYRPDVFVHEETCPLHEASISEVVVPFYRRSWAAKHGGDDAA